MFDYFNILTLLSCLLLFSVLSIIDYVCTPSFDKNVNFFDLLWNVSNVNLHYRWFVLVFHLEQVDLVVYCVGLSQKCRRFFETSVFLVDVGTLTLFYPFV